MLRSRRLFNFYAMNSKPSPLHISSEDESYKLDEKLREIDLAKKEQITAEEAAEMGLSYISFKGFPISPAVLGLVQQELAEKAQTVCFYKNDREARLGVVNVENPAIAEVRKAIQKKFPDIKFQIYLISEHSLSLALELYKAVSRIIPVVSDFEINGEDLKKFQEGLSSFAALQKALEETENMTNVFTMVIASAMNANSSDIHIEAEEKDVAIRFRVDGVLQVVARLESAKWPKVISRIKVLAGLKINVTAVPQDGRITIALDNDKMDIRVSTLPSAYGQSVVMRLLRSTATSLQFEDLGLRGKAERDLREQVKRPNGMIITTGPTGSGKTTTLYAVLNKLNRPEVKIITLENPIEYKLSGITQSQIDYSKGYTFAKGLRAILRQDPDIVMVGEIRDLETAEIAIQAALTGHLVISTIHTNDAAGAIPRFLSMNVKPFLLAPALNTVIGQRLVRLICKGCKEKVELEPALMEKIRKVLSEIPEAAGEKVDIDALEFYKGRGCEKCHDLGYKGRIGIYELFTMNKEIEQIVLSGDVSEYQMREVAVKNGMITMVQDGLLKARDGLTTVEEVFRVAE